MRILDGETTWLNSGSGGRQAGKLSREACSAEAPACTVSHGGSAFSKTAANVSVFWRVLAFQAERSTCSLGESASASSSQTEKESITPSKVPESTRLEAMISVIW